MQRRNRVARRRTPCRQVPKPQSDRTNGLVGLGIGDGERKSLSFGELAALPPDPRQGLLGGGLRGQAADEGDVRVVPKLDSQVGVLVGELTQNDTTVGRWCGRPGRQLRCSCVDCRCGQRPAPPNADLASEARQSQRVSAPIRPTSPVNLGRRGLITLRLSTACSTFA